MTTRVTCPILLHTIPARWWHTWGRTDGPERYQSPDRWHGNYPLPGSYRMQWNMRVKLQYHMTGVEKGTIQIMGQKWVIFSANVAFNGAIGVTPRFVCKIWIMLEFIMREKIHSYDHDSDGVDISIQLIFILLRPTRTVNFFPKYSLYTIHNSEDEIWWGVFCDKEV